MIEVIPIKKEERRLELESPAMRSTCTWTVRPYEGSLFPKIDFGLFPGAV